MRFTILPFCFIISTLASSPATRNEPNRFDIPRYTAGILPARISAQSIQIYLRTPLKFDRSDPTTTVPTANEERLGDDDEEEETWIEEVEADEVEEEEERKAWRLATELAILKRVWSSRARRDSFVGAAKGMIKPMRLREGFGKSFRAGENGL